MKPQAPVQFGAAQQELNIDNLLDLRYDVIIFTIVGSWLESKKNTKQFNCAKKAEV